jgi:hypothetical protein
VGHSKLLARLCEIHDFLVGLGIVNYGSNRYRHLDAFALAARAVAALAVTAPLGIVFRVVPEVEKRVVVFACNEHHISAASAVSAARAAAGDKLFATERQAAVSAIARFYRDENFVNKHLVKKKKASPKRLARILALERPTLADSDFVRKPLGWRR